MLAVLHRVRRIAGSALAVALASIPGAGGTAQDRDPSGRGAPAANRAAGEAILEPASMTKPDGRTVRFELGTLYVPENRADPRSRTIGVGFARFRAPEPTGAPPTLHLPGGPGESFLQGLRAGENRLDSSPFEPFASMGDVVLVYQRGFSERGEVLRFRWRGPDVPLDQPGSLE